MGTYDFDRFKDNNNTYLCKDTQGRKNLDDYKPIVDKKLHDLEESLKDRYVLIGDSYLEGYTPDGNVESFGVKLKRLLKKNDDDFIMVYHGGSGFISGGDTTFITMIDTAYSMTKKPERITHVIFAGGYNDQEYNVNNIQVKIIEAYRKVSERFPNATMYIANVASTFNGTKASVIYNLQDHVELAYDRAAMEGHSIVNMGYIGRYLHDRSMISVKDGIHPIDYGQNVIATAMYYKLKGGDYFPIAPTQNFISNYSDEYGHKSNITMLENISGDTLTVAIRNVYFFNLADITAGNNYLIGTLDGSHYIRGGYDTIFATNATGTVEVVTNGVSDFQTWTMTIGLADYGKFFVRLRGLNNVTLHGVKSIVLDYCFIRVPLGYC